METRPSASAHTVVNATPFGDLPEKERVAIQRKQAEAKARKKAAKLKKGPSSGKDRKSSSAPDFPCLITANEYFSATPYGEFRDESLVSCEHIVDLIIRLEREGVVVAEDSAGNSITLSQFNYFPLAGTEQQVWDYTVYAKLAFEGFFTITTARRIGLAGRSPLPELQPFYGKVLGFVRKEIWFI